MKKQFLLPICLIVLNVLCIYPSLAQSTQTCYGNLRCLSGASCNDTRDTISVCKGTTVRFQGSTQVFCYLERGRLYIPSEKLTSYTIDRNNNYICNGRANPRLTGPSITRQETQIVPGDAGSSCENAYSYFITAEAVINESGLYSIEWERTISRWNHGTGVYDVNTTRYISSTYYRVTGGGAIPYFTVSKNKANVNENIIIIPFVNYTNPNGNNTFIINAAECNGYSVVSRNDSNPFPYSSNKPIKLNLYASAIDNGCLTVKSGTREIIFKPCGRQSFGFYDTVLETEVRKVENAACDANSQSRQDYHFYDLEKTLCTRSTQCSINNIWNLYKSKISNQAPNSEDFYDQDPNSKIIASKVFLPPYNPNNAITSGTKINLYDSYNQALLTALPKSDLISIENRNKLIYAAPIAIHIDENNKCVTNYTLKGHALYPGKVTRCIVEECGKIKVQTFGEGITAYPESLNWLGLPTATVNQYYGKYLFENVDNRFAALVNQTYPQRVVQDLTTETLTDLGIENKNWIVRGFRIKHLSNDEITLFVRGDSGIFKVMNDVKMNFSTNGIYSGINVKNQAANGTWSTDGNTAITIDGANAQISSITADSFVIKGKMKSYVDTALVDADYTMVFQKIQCPTNRVLSPSVTYISTSIVRVEWNSSGSGVSYLVEYKPSTSSAWTPLPISTSTYNFIQGLTLSTSYNVRVIADCGSGSFETINFTMPSPCSVPNEPLVSNITATSARLNWSTSGSGVTYRIEYAPLNGSTNSFITNGTSSFLSGLTPSTTYRVKFEAFCNNTPSNDVLFTTAASSGRPFPVGLSPCLEDDFRELEKLYDAAGGNNWTNKTNWFTNPNMATWYGITLTTSGCDVNRISLTSNNLAGILPNINLPNVYALYFGDNKLTGNIPNFNMPLLVDLVAHTNQLNGNLPNFNLPNLLWLELSGNQLTGSIPNFNLAKLVHLGISGNKLTGNIPNFNMPDLRDFNLSQNQLTGSIPNFNMPNLTTLYLHSNQLSGSIPNFSMPNLNTLYLMSNQLTGSIPNFNMPNLEYLYLNHNQLTSSIPNFNLPKLKTLGLYNNQLTGSIPNFNLPNLTGLYLYNNQLTGSIPNFSLPNLNELYLYRNQLTSSIPNFNLPNMTKLDLGINQLTGSIPNFNLPNIQYLSLSTNQLSGSIPNFNLPNLRDFYLSANQLTGNIPDFSLPNLLILSLRDNLLSGNVPNFSNTKLNSAPPTYTRILLFGNKLTFGDIEGKSWLNTTDVRYEPQAKIPITFSGATLSVNTGSANNVQQFTWYKDDVVVATNQNNMFTPTTSGKYYCKVSHNTITTTSDTLRNLILQSEDYNIGTIPVELLNFTAHPLSKTVQLNWQTASEKNASHFEIERSSNGKTFTAISQVKAKGNSAALLSYGFTDETPLNGVNYYRLRQFDNDGKETLSNTVSVSFNKQSKLQVFPNPATNKLTIIGETNSAYVIFDALGREILRGPLSDNQTDINVSNLPSGMYFIKVKDVSVKFFKQ